VILGTFISTHTLTTHTKLKGKEADWSRNDWETRVSVMIHLYLY
jgi:hypothetical protein